MMDISLLDTEFEVFVGDLVKYNGQMDQCHFGESGAAT